MKKLMLLIIILFIFYWWTWLLQCPHTQFLSGYLINRHWWGSLFFMFFASSRWYLLKWVIFLFLWYTSSFFLEFKWIFVNGFLSIYALVPHLLGHMVSVIDLPKIYKINVNFRGFQPIIIDGGIYLNRVAHTWGNLFGSSLTSYCFVEDFDRCRVFYFLNTCIYWHYTIRHL